MNSIQNFQPFWTWLFHFAFCKLEAAVEQRHSVSLPSFSRPASETDVSPQKNWGDPLGHWSTHSLAHFSCFGGVRRQARNSETGSPRCTRLRFTAVRSGKPPHSCHPRFQLVPQPEIAAKTHKKHKSFFVHALQFVRITPFREDFYHGWTRMDTDGPALLIRVYMRQSVVQILSLRLAALGLLRLFAAILQSYSVVHPTGCSVSAPFPRRRNARRSWFMPARQPAMNSPNPRLRMLLNREILEICELV